MRVFISWAHRGEDWTDDRAQLWERHVERFAALLESAGLGEVLLDLWAARERDVNWNHWGPIQIEEADFILVAMNEPWAQRWSGKNNPKFGAGAAAEANALHGLFNEDQQVFQQKVRLICLPGCPSDPVPLNLSGVKALTVSALSQDGISEVLRDLKNVPRRPQFGDKLAHTSGDGATDAGSVTFRDGDMLLLRFRDLHPGIKTLKEHARLITADSERGAWWGWWKKPLESSQIPLWSAFQKHLVHGRGLVGLFDSGSPAGIVTRALAVEVLPPQPNEFGDTPPFAPPPEEWHRVPKYYRPKGPTHSNSCAWVRLQRLEAGPCQFYGNYKLISDNTTYSGVVIDHPSQLLTASDQSLWHVRTVAR